MKKAVHFGAGNIGRGFIGLLLQQSGYEVVFADVLPSLVEQLQTYKSYRVITLDETVNEEMVNNARAVMLDSEACRSEIVDADIVSTAVGLGNLNSVSAVIADGLQMRRQRNPEQPLNIFACENAIRATTTLKRFVMEHIDSSLHEWMTSHVGFADVAVDRIAPNPAQYATKPLDSVVERYFEWDIEEPALKGHLQIHGATFVQDLSPFLDRKLFVLNGAHATAAYAGFYKNYRTIREAMQDTTVLSLIEAVQEEAARGLAHRYSMWDLDDLRAYAKAARTRFLNPHIDDEVERVGRDPLRKLSGRDRLVMPLCYARSANIETPALVTAIALGLRYNHAKDESAVQIQAEIASSGIETVVARVTGCTDKAVIDAIVQRYTSLQIGF